MNDFEYFTLLLLHYRPVVAPVSIYCELISITQHHNHQAGVTVQKLKGIFLESSQATNSIRHDRLADNGNQR